MAGNRNAFLVLHWVNYNHPFEHPMDNAGPCSGICRNTDTFSYNVPACIRGRLGNRRLLHALCIALGSHNPRISLHTIHRKPDSSLSWTWHALETLYNSQDVPSRRILNTNRGIVFLRIDPALALDTRAGILGIPQQLSSLSEWRL
jgi:hypothetical protein